MNKIDNKGHKHYTIITKEEALMEGSVELVLPVVPIVFTLLQDDILPSKFQDKTSKSCSPSFNIPLGF